MNTSGSSGSAFTLCQTGTATSMGDFYLGSLLDLVRKPFDKVLLLDIYDGNVL